MLIKTMEPQSMSRSVTQLEMIQLAAMFPDIKVDFSQFKVTTEVYPQTSKSTVDTATDTRADFFLPPKGVIVKSWAIVGKWQLIDTAGADVVYAADVTGSVIPHNIPHLIQDFYILNNNSAGEVLYEITNHAGNYFDMLLQGKQHDQDVECYGDYRYHDVVSLGEEFKAGAASTAVETHNLLVAAVPISEYAQQIVWMNKEWWRKAQLLSWANSDTTDHKYITLLDSKLVPQKVDMLPLLLAGWGMTLWIDMRSDAKHRDISTGFAGQTYEDAKVASAWADSWFKFTDVWLYTVEIVPSNEFKQQLV